MKKKEHSIGHVRATIVNEDRPGAYPHSAEHVCLLATPPNLIETSEPSVAPDKTQPLPSSWNRLIRRDDSSS